MCQFPAWTMASIPKLLIALGALLIVVGVIWYLGGRYLNLGRLPGDLVVERPGFRFYFPLATCIVISVVLTLIFTVWQRLGR